MKHKVAELEGAMLDAAVATALGLKYRVGASDYGHDRPICYVDQNHEERAADSSIYGPSLYWDQGGPVIEREGISTFLDDEGIWCANLYPNSNVRPPLVEAEGPTLLVAAMRAVVILRLGEVIELP